MAKRTTVDSDPALESDLAPADTADDSVPRLTVDDGQGSGPAAPVGEYDGPELQSDLIPDPEVSDDAAEGAVDTTADATDTQATEPATPEPTANPYARFGVQSEDEAAYYIRIGREAAARAAAAAGQIPTPTPTPTDEVEEELDPELERIARVLEKRVTKTVQPLIQNTGRITEAYNRSESMHIVNHDAAAAKALVSDFIAKNAVTKGDPELAALLQEEVEEQVNNHIEGMREEARAGRMPTRIDLQKVHQLASAKAARISKHLVARNQRLATERTKVATATRSSAGGSTPTPGRGPVPKVDKGAEMERKLLKQGFRS